eukprot:TRINITY_DN21122_c0_g1_i1.p1 TRINITY_DN21122_c0_g1~~TRINITY_DN21122_c0_g1_i1.p1  ORF type:complete len:977 (-),score=142.22 TRINITY_DN21122_c0_g1_i1:174-2888(-)
MLNRAKIANRRASQNEGIGSIVHCDRRSISDCFCENVRLSNHNDGGESLVVQPKRKRLRKKTSEIACIGGHICTEGDVWQLDHRSTQNCSSMTRRTRAVRHERPVIHTHDEPPIPTEGTLISTQDLPPTQPAADFDSPLHDAHNGDGCPATLEDWVALGLGTAAAVIAAAPPPSVAACKQAVGRAARLRGGVDCYRSQGTRDLTPEMPSNVSDTQGLQHKLVSTQAQSPRDELMEARMAEVPEPPQETVREVTQDLPAPTEEMSSVQPTQELPLAPTQELPSVPTQDMLSAPTQESAIALSGEVPCSPRHLQPASTPETSFSAQFSWGRTQTESGVKSLQKPSVDFGAGGERCGQNNVMNNRDATHATCAQTAAKNVCGDMPPPPPPLRGGSTNARTRGPPNEKPRSRSFNEFVKLGMELRKDSTNRERVSSRGESMVDDVAEDTVIVQTEDHREAETPVACTLPPTTPSLEAVTTPLERAKSLPSTTLSLNRGVVPTPPSPLPATPSALALVSSDSVPQPIASSGNQASPGPPRSLVGTKVSPVILDEAITASSYFARSPGYGLGQMWRSRLDSEEASWCAGINDCKQWIQWDFGSPRLVSKLLTKGRYDAPQWITRYDLSYSQDGEDWTHLLEAFSGNSDQDTLVENDICPPIFARMLRLHPLGWHRHVSLRAEVLGHHCKANGRRSGGFHSAGDDDTRKSEKPHTSSVVQSLCSTTEEISSSHAPAEMADVSPLLESAPGFSSSERVSHPLTSPESAAAVAQEASSALARLLGVLAPVSSASDAANDSMVATAVAAATTAALAMGASVPGGSNLGKTQGGVEEMLQLIGSFSEPSGFCVSSTTGDPAPQLLATTESRAAARSRLTSLLAERIASTEAAAHAEALRSGRIVAVLRALQEAIV